jgi:hypothetical protein
MKCTVSVHDVIQVYAQDADRALLFAQANLQCTKVIVLIRNRQNEGERLERACVRPRQVRYAPI